MATTFHSCEKVGMEFVDSAPYRFANSVDLGVTPQQLFEVFADAAAWPTSSRPRPGAA
ncbi:MAG TPA: hypothetical protein VD859_16030 [Nocardioides sp.]|nr:hypothetical protein [Nocardioides sp.]